VAVASRSYRFVAAARSELRQSVLWYEERRPGLGQSFAAHVRQAVQAIVEGPERWPLRRGTRRYVLRKFPYTIAYRVSPEEVVILAVAHQRLDPRAWEQR
jgi:toxin ParE1/3/4